MKCFENLKNNIDFFLRQRLAFSRKNYSEQNESKNGLFEGETAEREKFLLEKYNLEHLKSNSTRQNYRENIYLLDILDKYFISNLSAPQPLSSSTVLDIGCKNWSYAKAEYAFFKKYLTEYYLHSIDYPSLAEGSKSLISGEGINTSFTSNWDKNLQLDGIELDANRLYSNFFSRKEVAKFYTKGINANYIEGNFLNHNGEYDFIIWILPFVVENPLIKWGLPLRYFKPEQMLKKAYDSLTEGGSMLILNQGEAEHDAQIKLCEKLKIKYTTFGEVKSGFMHYNIERYLMIIQKEAYYE